MGVLSMLVIAVGLAMDSFAVSIVGGISLITYKPSDAFRTGLFMGLAQAGFFSAGFALASTVSHLIQAWDHWIALVLLVGIGSKMIFEHHEEDKSIDIRRRRILTTLAIATSIDALAVGVSFSFLSYDILKTSIFIGVTSFLFSACGVYMGAYFSKIKQLPAYLIGGLLLIGIGLKIFIEHMIYHI